MFYTLLVIIHVIASALMILLILMQSSKGEGLSGAFGMGTGSSALFGADTATVLTKGTVVLAVIFAITCLSIALIQTHRGKSRVLFGGTGKPAGSVETTGDTATEVLLDTAADTEDAPDTAVE